MRNILRLGLMAIAVTFVFGSLTETKAQGVLNEILNRMDKNYKTMTSLESDVRMDKYYKQVGETDVNKGTVKYVPKSVNGKMYIRIDWTKPVEEQMSVIGDNYRLYRPRLNQAYEGKTSGAKNNAKIGGAMGFLSMSKDELKTNYNVKYLGEESVNGTGTLHLELTPKKAMSYKVAHLWVDSNGMPIQAKIIENNDDSTTVVLSNLKKNIKINGSDFNIIFPKNVKPIKG